jgi:hypothetical protein
MVLGQTYLPAIVMGRWFHLYLILVLQPDSPSFDDGIRLSDRVRRSCIAWVGFDGTGQ